MRPIRNLSPKHSLIKQKLLRTYKCNTQLCAFNKYIELQIKLCYFTNMNVETYFEHTVRHILTHQTIYHHISTLGSKRKRILLIYGIVKWHH